MSPGRGGPIGDDQGEVFATVQAARNHGARIAHELRHDAYQDCAVCITDAAGVELARVPLGVGRR